MAAVRAPLLLCYDALLVPANGVEVLASLAAPIKNIGKDAAGHWFHQFALRQNGLLSKFVGPSKLCTDYC